MEEEKRKKRVVRGELVHQEKEERERLKKLKGKEGGYSGGGVGGDDGEGVVIPTEEEVEEFFTILRRIKMAVKYFDEKGRGGKEWREALEQVEVRVDDEEENADDDNCDGEVGAVAKEKNDDEGIMNEAIDLNAAAPEAEENGGA